MISEQLWFTTADIEESVFWGEHSPPVADYHVALPSGTYRMVAGELYRVLPGVPPTVAAPHTPEAP